jgi:hypothetical protein
MTSVELCAPAWLILHFARDVSTASWKGLDLRPNKVVQLHAILVKSHKD